MTAPRVILASASPRRRELLTLVGIGHEVRPADLDEAVLPGEDPVAYVDRVARDKASTVAAHVPDTVVIAADTTVVLDGEIIAKPADATDAAAMLRRLSGRAHVVHTGMAVSYAGRLVSAVESGGVSFRALTDPDIAAYVATREPLDKAGAYGIQGYGATIVERVDGDYFSVMGLGLRRLVALLAAVGLSYEFARGIVLSD